MSNAGADCAKAGAGAGAPNPNKSSMSSCTAGVCADTVGVCVGATGEPRTGRVPRPPGVTVCDKHTHTHTEYAHIDCMRFPRTHRHYPTLALPPKRTQKSKSPHILTHADKRESNHATHTNTHTEVGDPQKYAGHTPADAAAAAAARFPLPPEDGVEVEDMPPNSAAAIFSFSVNSRGFSVCGMHICVCV